VDEMPDNTQESIRLFIKDWVNGKDSPHFAILIAGKWGCGKTHFIRNIQKDQCFTDRKSIYIALFGISSLEEFEKQLVFSSFSSTGRVALMNVGFFTNIFLKFISLKTGGIFGGSGDYNKAQKMILDMTKKWSDSINNAFIVIDDLERCSFEYRDLLGSLNQYIEHGDARIVLVANTKKLMIRGLTNFIRKLLAKISRCQVITLPQ
jgi:DNA polymerase III delta prime subunit